jgi:hypothetical protein
LVKEEYRVSAEIRPSKLAEDIRALVLQRLPLFLHEHTHGDQRLSYAWLNQEGNFVVRTYGKLAVAKLLKFGAISVSRMNDASAVARQEPSAYGKTAVQMWLSANTQVDMFEYASKYRLYSDPMSHLLIGLPTLCAEPYSSHQRRMTHFSFQLFFPLISSLCGGEGIMVRIS